MDQLQRPSSHPPTATIPSHVFKTDSQKWLPSRSPSLSAPSQNQQHTFTDSFPQQDFVLFDESPSQRRPNLVLSTPLQFNRHQYQQSAAAALASNSPSTQVRPLGHQNLQASNSTLPLAHSRPQRPPVPLFAQSTTRIGIPTMAGKDTDLAAFSSLDPGASASYTSPAVQSVFDLDFSGATGSVSPQDLLLHDPLMSAPNSSALTTLTSPSIGGESPQFSDCYGVSPEFGTTTFEPPSDEWFSLFPDESEPTPFTKTGGDPTLSPAQSVDTIQFNAANARKKTESRPAQGVRHSSVAGVNSRRRDKPLPPIVIEDPSDVVAMKRARNTLAARKSRERRAQRMEELEEQLAKVSAERDFWKSRAESLTGMQS